MNVAAGECILRRIYSCATGTRCTNVKDSTEVNKEGIISGAAIHNLTFTISIFRIYCMFKETLISSSKPDYRILNGTRTDVRRWYRSLAGNSHPRATRNTLLAFIGLFIILKP